jgi:hypothetical protein
MTEHRKFTRVPFIATADIIKNDVNLEAELIDLSLQGALLKFNSLGEIQLNDELNLKLKLNEQLSLSFLGKVVHHHDSCWGIKFMAEDLDSFTHLRKICEQNSVDPDHITGELAFLAEP